MWKVEGLVCVQALEVFLGRLRGLEKGVGGEGAWEGVGAVPEGVGEHEEIWGGIGAEGVVTMASDPSGGLDEAAEGFGLEDAPVIVMVASGFKDAGADNEKDEGSVLWGLVERLPDPGILGDGWWQVRSAEKAMIEEAFDLGAGLDGEVRMVSEDPEPSLGSVGDAVVLGEDLGGEESALDSAESHETDGKVPSAGEGGVVGLEEVWQGGADRAGDLGGVGRL